MLDCRMRILDGLDGVPFCMSQIFSTTKSPCIDNFKLLAPTPMACTLRGQGKVSDFDFGVHLQTLHMHGPHCFYAVASILAHGSAESGCSCANATHASYVPSALLDALATIMASGSG